MVSGPRPLRNAVCKRGPKQLSYNSRGCQHLSWIETAKVSQPSILDQRHDNVYWSKQATLSRVVSVDVQTDFSFAALYAFMASLAVNVGLACGFLALLISSNKRRTSTNFSSFVIGPDEPVSEAELLHVQRICENATLVAKLQIPQAEKEGCPISVLTKYPSEGQWGKQQIISSSTPNLSYNFRLGKYACRSASGSPAILDT